MLSKLILICDEGKFYSNIYTLKFQDGPNLHLPHPTTESVIHTVMRKM
jgi:hypothetical protein